MAPPGKATTNKRPTKGKATPAAAAAAAPTKPATPAKFAVGEAVKALWTDKKYYQGEIRALKTTTSPWKYSVFYEAHNKVATVPEAGIKKNDVDIAAIEASRRAAAACKAAKATAAKTAKQVPKTAASTSSKTQPAAAKPAAAEPAVVKTATPADALMAQFVAATAAANKDERAEKAAAFAAAAKAYGVAKAFVELKLNDVLCENMAVKGKAGAVNREAALLCANELCKVSPASATLMCSPIISMAVDMIGDKIRPVTLAAQATFDTLFNMCAANVSLVLPELLKKAYSVKGNLARFSAIQSLCTRYAPRVTTLLAEAVEAVTPFMININKEVEESARKTLQALCTTCTNPDMVPFFPALEGCMQDSQKVPETVFEMASSVFVAEVDGATLALLAPVLTSGLQASNTVQVKRQSARIIENMCKLVDEPRFVLGLTTGVLPLLKNAAKNVADPEARSVCEKALDRLNSKVDVATPLKFDTVFATTNATQLAGEMKSEMARVFEITVAHSVLLNEVAEYSPAVWEAELAPLLVAAGALTADAAKDFVLKFLAIAEASRIVQEEVEADDNAEVLMDLDFGLAFGNKVLLRKTKLKLLRGHRYGLLGQNDSGKTSLLRALADYKIEGFPTAEECRTVFVETDIKTELADLSVLDYMFNDPLLRDCGVTREEMQARLESVGFKEGAPANTTQQVGTLSGGWRMKLALSRAMLLKADILLLDEPTNHLDTYNVKWVEDYLLNLTDVTCIMVSHDSGLLTRVCTNIIEIDSLKLNYYKGNLASFVEAHPEAKCYFELADEGKYEFTFPNPGPLPGVKSKGKTILQMTDITFTYPGAKKPQLNNVTVAVSLASRVACVGENGAGKSTMIKLLTGELEPDAGSGSVVKHPNCRVGYIAQHAFHHIENHLDKTANDYIRWRYANGGDREELVKVTSLSTPEEEKLMAATFEHSYTNQDGDIIKAKITIDRLTEKRRDVKSPKGFEYEVTFKGSSTLHWLHRDVLMKRGFEKVLKQLDERIALRATQFARPLTKENVQNHLAAVGLEPEFATHMRISSLSGGQKVKVVLASALWSQPHILILDEPTNYLDRESLGALARAIRKFEGGVVMITHNSQFCDNLCPVVWHLQNNTLDVKGDAEWMAEAARAAIKVDKIDDSDMVDRFGNTIEIKQGTLTKKQLKAKAKRRQERFRKTGEDYDSEEEW